MKLFWPSGKRISVTRGLWLFFLLPILFIKVSYSQQSGSTILESLLQPADVFYEEIWISQEKVQQKQLLILFYQTTKFELAWQEESSVNDLLTAIEHADDEGLIPDDYHWSLLLHLIQKQKTETDRAHFDILMTDAFLKFSIHLLSGKTDPEVLYPGKWKASKRELNLPMLLKDALNSRSIAATLEGLKPGYSGYKKLRDQLKFFRSIQNEIPWTYIPLGLSSIEPGQVDDRIPLVRERLLITGQLLSHQTRNSTQYDSTLLFSVKVFQKQQGLLDDGIIGKQTLDALNYSPEYYISKIIVNMERYRWLPWELGKNAVMVNIPAYQLEVYEHDSVTMIMKVIVGRPDRPTPVFSSVIRYILLNPTWTVPPTILNEDILPAVRQNISYLQQHNLRVVNKKGEEVDPLNLPWNKYTARNFPYQLRQDPGRENSLGLVKFQFPNHYSVFLHDTNAHYLFSESYRALSSGCIRIEHPFLLAAYLLHGTSWTKGKLDKWITTGKSITISVPNPFPIHILYLTAFMDENDILQIRDDVYGLDHVLLNELGFADFLQQ